MATNMQMLMFAEAATAGGATLTIDGTAGGQFSGTNTGTVTLTTTKANDVIVLMFYAEHSGGAAQTISSVTSPHLTWAKRKGYSWTYTAAGPVPSTHEIWWAPASAALSSEVITITMTGTIDDAAYQVFGVNGCSNISSPWDTNASLPSANADTGATSFNTSSTVSGVSTDNPGMIIGSWGSWRSIVVTLPPGTTAVRAPQQNGGGSQFAYIQAFYETISSPASGLSFTTSNTSASWSVIIDALH